jgi:hypothetical protein
LPDSIFRHDLQQPQGVMVVIRLYGVEVSVRVLILSEWCVGLMAMQLHAIAKAMAAVFLPTPSIPIKRRAWGMVPF